VVAPVDLIADLERHGYFRAYLSERADVAAAHDAEWLRERATEGTFPVCWVNPDGVDFDEHVRGTEGWERDVVYSRLAPGRRRPRFSFLWGETLLIIT
jgi:hypothetical protein